MYVTQQHMIDRYGEESLIELTDRAEPATGAIVSAVLEAAIADACAVCDGYLAKRHVTPLAEPPVVLRRHVMAIAYYDLHRGHHPEQIRAAYDDAISFLKQVSRGEIILDVQGLPPPSAAAEARVEGPERIFNRESLKGY